MASWTYGLVIGFVFFFHAAALPDSDGDDPSPASKTIEDPFIEAGVQTGFARLQAALKIKEEVLKLQKAINKNTKKDLKSAKAHIENLSQQLDASKTALKTCQAKQSDTLKELQAAKENIASLTKQLDTSKSQRTTPLYRSQQTTQSPAPRGSTTRVTTPQDMGSPKP